MTEFKFQVGDLVQHRASGERAVVISRRIENAMNEYLLETGLQRCDRSAMEAALGDLWVRELSIEVSYPRIVYTYQNVPYADDGMHSCSGPPNKIASSLSVGEK